MRLILIALLCASGMASAADWTVQPGSTLSFGGSFQGEAFAGKFSRFTPRIRFDPAKPAGGHFDVAIDLSSASTNNDERDELLLGDGFFNTRKQAQARFIADKFRALGGGRYAADGTLTLNGKRLPVTLAFTWKTGTRPVLDGQATLKRLDFGIGSGDWADTSELRNEVKVSTHLVLSK